MPGAICFLSLSVSKDPIPRVRNAQVVFLPNGPGSVMDPHTQKVYVCLFTCTRCEPHRERAFYSNLLTSNFLNFLSSKHGKVRTTSYPLREEMRNMMGLNSITNYQSTAFCLDQLRVFGVKMSS